MHFTRREFFKTVMLTGVAATTEFERAVINQERELYVALVIGINNWPPDSGLPRLHGAVLDAERVGECLRKVGYKVILMTPNEPKDRQPTRGNILTLLRYLLSMKNIEALLIYWSGHGISHNKVAFLMPMDARLDYPELTGLSLEQISKIVADANIEIPHLILIVDACKVGVDNPSKGFIEALQKSAGKWLVITSCSEGERAREISGREGSEWDVPETKEPHGLFTLYMLVSRYGVEQNGRVVSLADTIYGDGIISFQEAFDYAKSSVERWCKTHPRDEIQAHVQTPQMFGHLESAKKPFCKVEPLPKPNGGNLEKIRSEQLKEPPVDEKGRFWVYRNMVAGTVLPFVPYGWMWGGSTRRQRQVISPQLVNQMMLLDLEHQKKDVEDTCIFWQIIWEGKIAEGLGWNAVWAAIGWIAGPDTPPWWAQRGDNRGWYYNLEHPRRFQRLKFSACSPLPGTRIQVKVGFLARDVDRQPLILGDSLAWPIATNWLTLDREWKEFVLELKPLPVEPHECDDNRNEEGVCVICGDNPINPKRNNLERICSLAFVVERIHQSNPNAPIVQMFLDNIYFE